jgi:polyphenol oxidase
MIKNPSVTEADWYCQEGYLACRLLSQWQHGFFTRSHSPHVPQDLQKYFNFEPNSEIKSEIKAYHAKQVHGDRIVTVSEFGSEFNGDLLPEADGVFTNQKLTSVWACSADCVPILIGDRLLGNVAAIHGGWRGTAKGILIKAIAKFQTNGSDLANLLIALGPAISGASYQVQTDVADQVLATIKNPVGVFPDPQSGHCRLDLRLVQQQQLLELGLTNSQIAIAPYCTFQTPEHFFSYRRNCLEKSSSEKSGLQNSDSENFKKAKPQIQWSGIAI